MTDLLASEPQYVHHLLPVWRALEDPGTFWVTTGPLLRLLESQGVEAQVLKGDLEQPVLVASFQDWAKARRAHAPLKAFMEHGCGQAYPGDSRSARAPSYSGGDGREGASLILAPNEYSAARWRARYPEVPVRVIGATRVLTPPEDSGRPTIALAFHWSGGIPEMRSAVSLYLKDFTALSRSFPLIGHAHPRAASSLGRRFAQAGIEWVPDLEEVAARATIFAVDNSSTLWEMGRTRPTIALNAPWYRREVEHGLRFWSHAGLQVDTPGELAWTMDRLLTLGEEPEEQEERERVVRDVIPGTDGATIAAALLGPWSRGEGVGMLGYHRAEERAVTARTAVA